MWSRGQAELLNTPLKDEHFLSEAGRQCFERFTLPVLLFCLTHNKPYFLLLKILLSLLVSGELALRTEDRFPGNNKAVLS
jgi:hypothetical protein